MKKRLVSALLAILLFAGLFSVPTFASSIRGFTDMPAKNNWAYAGIKFCVENDLMNGTSATKFTPNGTLTRGQLVTILYRLEGSPDVTYERKFSDVPFGKFYSVAVAWASKTNVVNGFTDGTFRPDAKITREQIATILYRYNKTPEVHGNLNFYTDGKQVGSYATDAMIWATDRGYIAGIPSIGGFKLAPKANATRAQIAAIIMRFLGRAPISSENLVGISMPTKDLQRWNQDGTDMEAMLKEAGYDVDLQFAANDPTQQVNQIQNMISNGAKVLVIAAIDSESLGTVLAEAKEAGAAVIAYNRLIMGSDAVTCYATFDNTLVGVMQGQYIEKTLDLANAGDKTYNIEFITGDPGDNNINFFYDGAMSVLQKYLDAGTLVVQSGQTAKMDVATEGWDAAKAQERFENILSTYYADKPIHAVLASNDSTAQGVTIALSTSYSNDVYPIITGQDCDIVSTKNMLDGKQAMSVLKDTRDLAAKAVEMCKAIMEGTEPEINDNETYDNGTGIIPSYLCAPKVCTKENMQEILIDSGYYTWDSLRRW